MFGNNPKRSATFGDGNILEIQKIFKTIQGEGPFAGRPSIFVRLGGCNLACSFCDTEFEDFSPLKLQDIIGEITKLSLNKEKLRSVKLIVITGGEPFRQPIEKLCESLVELGFTVQIETNGTIYRDLPREIHIVCSPKPGPNGYKMIREDLLSRISAIKFLIAKNLKFYDSINEVGQTKYNIPVYIQPIDQNNEKFDLENIELAIEQSLETGSYLSTQIHKYLNIE